MGFRIEIRGGDLDGLLNEAGGHRVQRVPPTERRGRVHTSTVTVAVMDDSHEADPALLRRDESDFSVEWFHGTIKAGGQHRNKHACSCRVKHLPTGIIVSRQGRDRVANLRDAKAAIIAALDGQAAGEVAASAAKDRKRQVGSGMRGDKTVTIRFQDDSVHHHATGRRMQASKYMRGYMDELWP